MFAIGASLREARQKRGLDVDAVQRALRIRRRYLEAMEDDRFELIPGEVYARGFLREYAEFLGLDGSLYTEEYNARYATREETPMTAAPSAPRLRRGRSLRLVPAVLLATAVAVGLVAWQLGDRTASKLPARPAAAATEPVPAAKPKPAKPAAATVQPAKPRVSRLMLTAARGDCWVIARAGSATGRVLYEDILRRGRTLRLAVGRRPLWLRLGDGRNLDARLDGRALPGVPRGTGNLLVGRD